MQAKLDDATVQLQQRTQAFNESQAALATMQAEMDGVTQRVAQMEGDMAGEGAWCGFRGHACSGRLCIARCRPAGPRLLNPPACCVLVK